MAISRRLVSCFKFNSMKNHTGLIRDLDISCESSSEKKTVFTAQRFLQRTYFLFKNYRLYRNGSSTNFPHMPTMAKSFKVVYLYLGWDSYKCLICVFYSTHFTCWVELLVTTYVNKEEVEKRRKPKTVTSFAKWSINIKIQSQS